jgi:hypothetical protein
MNARIGPDYEYLLSHRSAQPAAWSPPPAQVHNPVQPWHYDLHVWVWWPIPAGTGLPARHNAAVSC